MASMVIWMLALAGSIGLLMVTAAGQYYALHLLIAALASFGIAIMAVRENERSIRSGAQVFALAAINARYMGLIWAWGTVALIAMYGLLLEWKEWWQFAIAFGAAAVLCLAFSNLLASGERDKVKGEKVLRISRILAIVQLVGMLVVMLGLLIDGKMDFGERDWAANNVFFLGAAALAVISYVSLRNYNRILAKAVPERSDIARSIGR